MNRREMVTAAIGLVGASQANGKSAQPASPAIEPKPDPAWPWPQKFGMWPWSVIIVDLDDEAAHRVWAKAHYAAHIEVMTETYVDDHGLVRTKPTGEYVYICEADGEKKYQAYLLRVKNHYGLKES